MTGSLESLVRCIRPATSNSVTLINAADWRVTSAFDLGALMDPCLPKNVVSGQELGSRGRREWRGGL
jgi:hypothetical protein